MNQELFPLTVRYFFLFAPVFALMMFLSLTRNFEDKRRKSDATKIALTSFLFSVVIIFLGEQIFKVLGITLNAFRVGVGTILLLDGIGLVRGKITPPKNDDKNEEIVFVPMTIPVIIGPAVIGTLLVAGNDVGSDLNLQLLHILALFITCVLVWIILYLCVTIEKYVGTKNLVILSKMTGIYLAALASQMIMQGVKNDFLK